KPGGTVGTSDLVLDTTAGSTISGNASLDNYGDRYTGRAHIGLTVTLIDPFHHGDVLTLSGLSSGPGLNYGRLAYEFLLNGHGTRIGASASALRYVLGEQFESLHAHGTPRVTSL